MAMTRSPGSGEAGELAGEGLVEAVVVADAGDEGTVGGQRDRGEGAPVFCVAAGKFGGEVGGLGGAAAVAADQQFVAAAEGAEDEVGGGVDRRADRREAPGGSWWSRGARLPNFMREK